MLKLTLHSYNTLCETQSFEINGIKASYKDFGEKFDAAPNSRKPYMCCNMVFRSRKPQLGILEKYNIDADDYTYICIQLRNALSFGTCKLCS